MNPNDDQLVPSASVTPLSRPTAKLCAKCSNEAHFSLSLLVSTLGTRPRLQKCSHSLLLCHACMREATMSAYGLPVEALCEQLRGAYTAIVSHPHEASNASDVNLVQCDEGK
jgi:hypothetical protein